MKNTMMALKNMETFVAETYTNGKLTNSLNAIGEKKSETEKKIDIILHYGRIIIKGPNSDVIKNYFISEDIIDESDKNTPIDEVKFLVKEKLEKHSDEILANMLNNFKEKSWRVLLDHSQNAPLKPKYLKYLKSNTENQA